MIHEFSSLFFWVLCSQKPSENRLSPHLTHRRWTCSLYFATINPRKLQALELFGTRVELIFPQDVPTNILIKPFFYYSTIYWHPLWVRNPPISWLGIRPWTKLTKSSPVGLTSRFPGWVWREEISKQISESIKCQDVKYSMGNMANNTVITMYGVRRHLDLPGWSLRKV